MQTLEVEIDELGTVRPVDPAAKLPPGRAVLGWPEDDSMFCALMSEQALARDWISPEEDEAWAYLAQEK